MSMADQDVFFKILFIISPDEVFNSDGLGKATRTNYRKFFKDYKQFFVTKWDSPRIQVLVERINTYVFRSKLKTSHVLSTAEEEDFSKVLERAMLDCDSPAPDSANDLLTPSTSSTAGNGLSNTVRSSPASAQAAGESVSLTPHPEEPAQEANNDPPEVQDVLQKGKNKSRRTTKKK